MQVFLRTLLEVNLLFIHLRDDVRPTLDVFFGEDRPDPQSEVAAAAAAAAAAAPLPAVHNLGRESAIAATTEVPREKHGQKQELCRSPHPRDSLSGHEDRVVLPARQSPVSAFLNSGSTLGSRFEIVFGTLIFVPDNENS